MRTATPAIAASLILAAFTGCSEGYNISDGAEAWDTGWWNGAPQAEDSGLGDTAGDSLQVEPRWWAMSGSLTLNDGVVGKSDASLTLTFSGDDQGVVTPVCDAPATLLAVTPTSPTDPDVAFDQWWTIELTVPNTPGCVPASFAEDTAGTVSLGLGIGPVDPLLGPAMDAAGYPWDPWADALHGLYLQSSSSDPLYVFGVTGTTEQFASTTPTDSGSGTLEDGTYELQSLYLIPL